MGLEVVEREIVDEGRREADAIEKDGFQQAKAILEDARAKATSILEERGALAAREAERIRQQDIARAEFDAKKRVLVAKRGLWDRLREELLEELAQLSQDDRRRILGHLMDISAQEIPAGVVHVRTEDTQLVSDAGRYKVVDDLTGTGGVVVEDEEGTVSVDMRFETLLDDLWPQILKEESSRLFPDKA